jgi:hypothetical protein
MLQGRQGVPVRDIRGQSFLWTGDLRDVVEHDDRFKRLDLAEQQKNDLIEDLRSL